MFDKIISKFRKTPSTDVKKQYKLPSQKPAFSFSDLDPKQQKSIRLLQQDPEITPLDLQVLYTVIEAVQTMKLISLEHEDIAEALNVKSREVSNSFKKLQKKGVFYTYEGQCSLRLNWDYLSEEYIEKLRGVTGIVCDN